MVGFCCALLLEAGQLARLLRDRDPPHLAEAERAYADWQKWLETEIGGRNVGSDKELADCISECIEVLESQVRGMTKNYEGIHLLTQGGKFFTQRVVVIRLRKPLRTKLLHRNWFQLNYRWMFLPLSVPKSRAKICKLLCESSCS